MKKTGTCKQLVTCLFWQEFCGCALPFAVSAGWFLLSVTL